MINQIGKEKTDYLKKRELLNSYNFYKAEHKKFPVSEEEYHKLKKNFERFDANIDDDKVRDMVKNEIILYLYNKRNMIVKNSEEQELICL